MGDARAECHEKEKKIVVGKRLGDNGISCPSPKPILRSPGVHSVGLAKLRWNTGYTRETRYPPIAVTMCRY